MSEPSLRNKTIKGVGWSAADAFLGQGITFVVGIVLARLLTPEEYGVVGMCLIFTTILNGIVDCGFGNAIVRKKKPTNDDYNTMFFINMVVSIILYATLYILAPYISSFFKMNLTNLIRAMGLVLIINGLSHTQQTNLTKKIDFKTKTKASVISAIFSGIIGISMAYCDFGAWAIVMQQLSRQTIYTICLWILNRWVPNLHFSINSFKYLWGFGWKLLVSGLLDRIWNQLYQIIVGKFYNAIVLGQYTRAHDYANIFSTNITSIIQRVTYPILAEVQDDKKRMVAAYRKIIKITMFVTCTCMISLGAVAEPLIYCLIGAKWHQAATFLPLICVNMSMYPLHALNLNMLQIQGRSDIFLFLEIIKKILYVFPIYIGIKFNIYGMLVASIIIGFICFFLNTFYTGRKLNYSSWNQLKDIIPSYVISFAVALSMYFIKFLPINNWIILFIQIVVGAFMFFLICETIKLQEYIELKKIAISTIKKVWKKK